MLPDKFAVRRAVHGWYMDDPVRARVRLAAMHIQACRLYECGYEPHLDEYNAPDLLLLATLVHMYQAAIFILAALDRCDAKLLFLLEQEGVDLSALRQAAAPEATNG